MAKKYLELLNGKKATKEATVQSTGVSQAGDIVALDSTGKLDPSVMPVGVAADVKVAAASEDLVGGNYVNFWNDSGVEKVRLADFSNGRDAHGFVKASHLTGSNATVYFEGPNDDLSGLTPGARYYLDSAGGVTSTPKATGLHQFVGVAVDVNTVNTDIDDCIVLN